MYMRIKCNDLIEQVNNLMKNYAVRASKKVGIHTVQVHHCMAAGARFTEKPCVTVEKEKHLQCVYESHQVRKLHWLQMHMMNWLMCCNVLFSCGGSL